MLLCYYIIIHKLIANVAKHFENNKKVIIK